MVSSAGFEPTTLRLGIVRSIQLSYGDIPLGIQEEKPYLALATRSLRPFPGLNLGTYLSFVL